MDRGVWLSDQGGQVRTSLQHGWAELSEKMSDAFGLDVKYGGGPQEAREVLIQCSDLIAATEITETQLGETLKKAKKSGVRVPAEIRKQIANARSQLRDQKRSLTKFLTTAVKSLEKVAPS